MVILHYYAVGHAIAFVESLIYTDFCQKSLMLGYVTFVTHPNFTRIYLGFNNDFTKSNYELVGQDNC
ncbi:hypothetical protein [Nostoc sp.]|uniref:hypothetical protein n=1 Tax=Nostoc sp. TaxID=1180 RepID=UPI002FFD2FE2